jgi:hypothetical protein
MAGIKRTTPDDYSPNGLNHSAKRSKSSLVLRAAPATPVQERPLQRRTGGWLDSLAVIPGVSSFLRTVGVISQSDTTPRKLDSPQDDCKLTTRQDTFEEEYTYPPSSATRTGRRRSTRIHLWTYSISSSTTIPHPARYASDRHDTRSGRAVRGRTYTSRPESANPSCECIWQSVDLAGYGEIELKWRSLGWHNEA